MRKYFLLFTLLSCLHGFSQQPEDPFFKQTLYNFKIQTEHFFQEKVWLHTDRNLYQTGEKIWFRAFLVNAATHQFSPYSRYVYIELANPSGKIIQRIKLKETDTIYAGHLDLSEQLPEGDYYLRAYSYYMLNQGEDYICMKKIRIINPDERHVQTFIDYPKENEEEYIEISFENLRGTAYPDVPVRCHYSSLNGKTKTQHIRTDERGKIRIKRAEVTDSLPLHVSFSDSDPFPFERQLYLPGTPDDFDLAFFPEGGVFPCGETQTIAFKAIGSDGLSVEVNGYVYDHSGEIRTVISTLHKGMGMIQLQAGQADRFYAIVKDATGREKRFDLPVPDANALTLSVQQRDTLLSCRVKCGMEAVWPDSLYLLGHIRGEVVLFEPVEKGQHQVVQTSAWGKEGILHLQLVDNKCRIFSQRLCFIRGKGSAEIMMGTNKKSYFARELMTLQLNFRLPETAAGSFSLSVTDDEEHNEEHIAENNIVSELLLNSDLKGYIEDPAWYFRNVNRTTNHFLDILMLTQGWSRFDVEKILSGKHPDQKFFLERGQAVSGKVDNIWGKDVKDAQLILLSSNRITRMFTTDTAGRFMVNGIDFPDATSFFVQAKGKRGGRTVAVHLDKDEFPEPDFHFPTPRYKKEDTRKPYEMKLGQDYYYMNGMKVNLLDEIQISASRIRRAQSFYEQMCWSLLDSSDFANAYDKSIFGIVELLAGVAVNRGESTISRYGRPLRIVINDRLEDFSYFEQLQQEDVVSIGLMEEDMVKIHLSSLLIDEENSTETNVEPRDALVITMSKNFIPKSPLRPNIQVFSPLGYQKPEEFYIPRYDVDSVRMALKNIPDKRKTVYWNPDVRMDNSAPVKLNFHTTDNKGPYTIVLEGILQDGRIFRQEQKIVKP